MHDLGDLSQQLCRLFQSQGTGAAPASVGGATLCCAADGGQRIELHFQAPSQRWQLGVGCTATMQEARANEALLRIGHASRWCGQQAGLAGLEEGQGLSLVDCDFPSAPAQLTPAVVENHLRALLAELDALTAGAAAMPRDPVALAGSGQRGHDAPACRCTQAFSAQMQRLDVGRLPGSSAPQELLLDGGLPLRISLQPRHHHWVIEAFAGSAASLGGPLRQGLVSALLHINRATLGGRQIICSLDTGDRLLLISRWHADWNARLGWPSWLAYTVQQARRIRAAAAAIAMQDLSLADETGGRL